MADTSDFRNGLCMEFNGKLVTIVSFQHVKPGKGPAFVRTKLRNIETGKVIDNTFTSGVKINVVRIERRPYSIYIKMKPDTISCTSKHSNKYRFPKR